MNKIIIINKNENGDKQKKILTSKINFPLLLLLLFKMDRLTFGCCCCGWRLSR